MISNNEVHTIKTVDEVHSIVQHNEVQQTIVSREVVSVTYNYYGVEKFEEQLSGIDNSNTTFQTSSQFLANSTELYYNGLKLQRGIDYNEVGLQTIETVFIPSDLGFTDILIIKYIKA